MKPVTPSAALARQLIANAKTWKQSSMSPHADRYVRGMLEKVGVINKRLPMKTRMLQSVTRFK